MSSPSPGKQAAAGIVVRPMRETDFVQARRIFRTAFGTFIGVPEPENLWPDREYIATRYRMDPSAALTAEMDDAVAGSAFAARWGSFAVFGPLTVRPDLWDRGVGKQLLDGAMDLFSKWAIRGAGLFTFSNSPKHIGLYQKYGFWPRFLTALMSKSVEAGKPPAVKLSSLDQGRQRDAIEACRRLTGSIYEGLDLTMEIRGVASQNLGDTLLVWDGDALDALAVCHCGEGTEAGKDSCYVKFAAVQPGPRAERAFDRLLDGLDALASERGLQRINGGMNFGRAKAYCRIVERGFRAQMLGVVMQRPDAPAYNRPDVFVIDDWR